MNGIAAAKGVKLLACDKGWLVLAVIWKGGCGLPCGKEFVNGAVRVVESGLNSVNAINPIAIASRGFALFGDVGPSSRTITGKVLRGRNGETCAR